MTRDGPLRVAALPLLSDSPYQRLLHDALEAHGVGTVHATPIVARNSLRVTMNAPSHPVCG